MKNKQTGKLFGLILCMALMLALLAGCGMDNKVFVIHPDGSIDYSTQFYVSDAFFKEASMDPETYYEGKNMLTIEHDGMKYYAAEEDKEVFNLTMGIEAINAAENSNFWFAEETESGARYWDCHFAIPTKAQAAESADVDADALTDLLYRVALVFPEGYKDYPAEYYSAADDAFYFPPREESYNVTISGWLDEPLKEDGPKTPEGLEKAITTIIFNVDTPKAGFVPDDLDFHAEVKCNGAPADAIANYNMNWFRIVPKTEENSTGEEWLGSMDPFTRGEEYYLELELTISKDYRLDFLGAVLLNGSSEYIVDEEKNTVTMFWECGPVEKPVNPFVDVPSGSYFEDAVLWAFYTKPQITDGTSATTFSPDKTCTRGQVVTFLWRQSGCPEPETKANPFTDVKAADYFYKPVLWAVENKITDGTAPDKFSPANPCTNAHILTFIHRTMCCPEVSAEAYAGGSLVPDPIGTKLNQQAIDALKQEAQGMAEWCRDAYVWSSYNGLLQGSYTGKYDVKAPCPRKNVVYYLYNMQSHIVP